MAAVVKPRPRKKGAATQPSAPSAPGGGASSRSRWALWLAILAVAAVVLAVYALRPSAAENDQRAIARVRASLAANYPDLTVTRILASPAPGIYEVDTSNSIIYMNATGEYVMVGTLLAARTHEDLTTRRINELNTVPFNFDELPFSLAIKEVKGNGERRLVLFEDPLCPFCERLEHELSGVDNVTIYRFLFPLENIRQGATAASHAIWCASDRAAVWDAWMLQRVEPKGPDCAADPVADIQTLARSIKVSGTPTLLFPSGRRVYGFQTKEILEQLLSGEQSKSAGAARG